MLQKLSKTAYHQNREICEKEIQKAISTFDNKSTGNDNPKGEFYKTFFETLVNDIQELYKEISEIGRMPDGMPQALIICIYKKGDMEDITNWRPIRSLTITTKLLQRY